MIWRWVPRGSSRAEIRRRMLQETLEHQVIGQGWLDSMAWHPSALTARTPMWPAPDRWAISRDVSIQLWLAEGYHIPSRPLSLEKGGEPCLERNVNTSTQVRHSCQVVLQSWLAYGILDSCPTTSSKSSPANHKLLCREPLGSYHRQWAGGIAASIGHPHARCGCQRARDTRE